MPMVSSQERSAQSALWCRYAECGEHEALIEIESLALYGGRLPNRALLSCQLRAAARARILRGNP
jgi:hypothetical protein